MQPEEYGSRDMKTYILFSNPHVQPPDDWVFTGRIKYTHGIKTKIYFEIEITRLIHRVPKVIGYLWWKQKHKPEDTFTKSKCWIYELDIYESDTREDYIHDCNHT